MVKNTEIFQSGLVVMGDLPKWKTLRFFEEVKNTKIFQSGLVVTGDLPRCNIFGGGEKYDEFSKWFYCNRQPAPDGRWKGGEKFKDFSKWFYCNGQPTQMEDEKSFQRGMIMMGDLPRWKKNEMSWRNDMIGLEGVLFKRRDVKPENKVYKEGEVYNNSKCCYNII